MAAPAVLPLPSGRRGRIGQGISDAKGRLPEKRRVGRGRPARSRASCPNRAAPNRARDWVDPSEWSVASTGPARPGAGRRRRRAPRLVLHSSGLRPFTGAAEQHGTVIALSVEADEPLETRVPGTLHWARGAL